jgi:hypothetical protein
LKLQRTIYIWLDGPKNQSDFLALETAEKVQYFLEKNPSIDFQLHISNVNLGCGKSLPSGVTWVLKNHETVIVLEDDIRPTDNFFSYMDWALDTYEGNSQISHINGWNPLGNKEKSSVMIYKSRHVFGWGWGTWRNRWKLRDLALNSFSPEISLRNLPTLSQYKLGKKFEQHWKTKLIRCADGLDAWDYQWQYSVWKSGGLAIMPTVSFISNIGFDNRATHTKRRPRWLEEVVRSQNQEISVFSETEMRNLGIEIDNQIDSKIFDINPNFTISSFKSKLLRIFS